VRFSQQLLFIESQPHFGAEFTDLLPRNNNTAGSALNCNLISAEEIRDGFSMSNLISLPRTVVTKANLLTELRTLVAEHLGVDVEDINLHSHFADDLGLDPLDVLELAILVEERFPNLEIMEGGELSFFGDLIEQIQFVDDQRTRTISWNSENWNCTTSWRSGRFSSDAASREILTTIFLYRIDGLGGALPAQELEFFVFKGIAGLETSGHAHGIPCSGPDRQETGAPDLPHDRVDNFGRNVAEP
jgi:acyl carrier protein